MSAASRFVCFNPQCPNRRKSFASEKGLTLHFQRSPDCLLYVRNSSVPPASSRQPTRQSVASTLVSSSAKRTAVLRRNVKNEFLNNAQAIAVDSATKNAEHDAHAMCDGNTFPINDCDFDVHNTATLPAVHQIMPTQNFPSQETWLFTNEQKWTIALLKMLDDMNAPDYAFGFVLEWARAASASKYSFAPPGGLSRNRNIDVLFASLTNARQLLPSVVNVDVKHGPPVDVIVFDFVPQLLRLLQNPKIMTADNLLIDPMNPLLPYTSPNGILGEAISGSVYRDAYQRLITKPDRQLFVPIIQWIDRTSVTGNDRFSLKPYMFTPAIFKVEFRNTIEAWGYHGFLPKPSTSSAQNQTQTQGNNIRNYHMELYTVLLPFTSASPRLLNIKLPLGPDGFMYVDIITCILFVIQDMQEGDALCGRFGSHTTGIQRHCRACNVPAHDLDNPHAVCRFFTKEEMHVIATSENVELRKQHSQHYLNNAFGYIPLADPIRGIFGATPVETLHAFRKGLIEKVTFLVIKNVPVSKQARLDALAIKFHRTHRQTYRRVYPATDFSNGVTNLTKISAAERVGLMFLFVILSQYDEGWEILASALNQTSRMQLRDVIAVFEALLCFDQWLNMATYWRIENSVEAKLQVQTSIRTLLSMCKQHIPLAKNKTWKYPKFHELLHIVEDIERFGAPINYCAQRTEALLIPVAKEPGRRAQKRHQGSSYEQQAAQRLSYSLMITEVHSRIWGTEIPSSHTDPAMDTQFDTTIIESTGQATFATLTRDCKQQLHVRWNTTTDVSLMQLPMSLLEFMWNEFGPTVRFCTEYVRDVYTFRCHPAYQSDNAMNDWMLVNYVMVDAQTNQEYIQACPCRLAAVVLRGIDDNNSESYHLIVQSAQSKTGIKSVLLTEWNWSPSYEVIFPSNIVGPCFVVSIKDDMSKILETLPLENWASDFTEPFDDAEDEEAEI